MPGYREVTRCANCGTVVTSDISALSQCTKCAADLHTCAQCASFDPGSRFECMQPVTMRVSPKNLRNSCQLYSARTTVERETTSPRGSTDSADNSARKAFDDLFNS